MRMYSQEYDEHFPAGKGKPLDSLALLADEGFCKSLHCYTSHALGQELAQYYEKHKEIPEELCCYRYNEGLTENAPIDSVLMYYYKPIKWATWDFPAKEKGRFILFLDGHMNFHPEEEFQKFQKDTIAYLKERSLEAPIRSKVASFLKLILHSNPTGEKEFNITAELINIGSEHISIDFLGHGSIDGGCLFDPSKETPKIELSPNGKFTFPGVSKVAASYTMENGKVTSCSFFHLGSHSSSSSERDYDPPISFDEFKEQQTVKALIQISVKTKTIPSVDLVIYSQKFKFLKHND